MAIWQKRFVLSINVAILLIYLDICLLIFIRSVDGNGIYQTMEMKWLTALVWTLCYAGIWVCQGLAYMIFTRYTNLQKKKIA